MASRALTRRRYPGRPDCWHIYFGDVRVGTIARRVGNPFDTDPWEWDCGFYPGSHPGEHRNDTAATFDEARADFERAWAVFLSKRTEPISKSARQSRLDRAEIRDAENRREVSLAKAQLAHEMPLQRDLRQSPAGTYGGPCASRN